MWWSIWHDSVKKSHHTFWEHLGGVFGACWGGERGGGGLQAVACTDLWLKSGEKAKKSFGLALTLTNKKGVG